LRIQTYLGQPDYFVGFAYRWQAQQHDLGFDPGLSQAADVAQTGFGQLTGSTSQDRSCNVRMPATGFCDAYDFDSFRRAQLYSRFCVALEARTIYFNSHGFSG
jgi:hypothetical protein